MKDKVDKLPDLKDHSRLGIVSVLIAVIVPLLIAFLFLLSSLLGTAKGSAGNYVAIVFIVIGMVAPLLHLLGFLLALIAIFFKKTDRLFPIIGLFLNLFFGICGLIIIFVLVRNMSVPH